MMPNKDILALAFANPGLFEELYSKYKQTKDSVDSEWQKIFEAFDSEVVSFPTKTFHTKITHPTRTEAEFKIFQLIQAYRTYGYLAAKVNPLDAEEATEPRQLNLEELGFRTEELSQTFPTLGILKKPEASLLEIVNALKEIYCGHVGIEYIGFQSPEFEEWLQKRIEPNRFKNVFSVEQKQEILQYLNKSELLESFLHTKYVGQKRFSIEGGETFIPIMAALIEVGADMGVTEFYLGMAHRGRLNLLANILNKSYKEIFSEFDEGYIPESLEGSGDVKYHKGFYSNVQTVHGHKVQVTLTPNPSHLESVNPVVEGEVRARQDQLKDSQREKVVAILVHGDAALSGQGVIYENLQLYRLENYTTGGSIHIVINNQIGFTTLPKEARSTSSCTDVAKAFGAPIFHVNGEDPEACVYAAILAMEIRHKFHFDVFIDLNCYRKYGHNESDEPAFTQPIEYKIIRSKKPIRDQYRDQLIEQGVLEKYMAESMEAEFKKSLNQALKIEKPHEQEKENNSKENQVSIFQTVETGVNYKILREIAEEICLIPKNFNLHPKLQHLLKERLAMVVPEKEAKPLDWGMAELLAYGSLLYEGTPLRLAGQDTCRGTFSHRHAMWMDQVAEKAYFPLSHLAKAETSADVVNSPLSEFAALAFEYGYSVAYPQALVIWEAQFGDFANGAQVVIDQYIASGEQKWGQKTSLTLFLPHGYEGQGPEHSSARLERFLTLAGNDNMFIANPTTPAQFFHLLRRQILGRFQKPLVVLTPKGLLRHPECISHIKELEKGHFSPFLDDPSAPKSAKKLLICSGRIFYDLQAYRKKEKINDTVILRIEQLYPFDEETFKKVMERYASITECFYVQDEHQNMGAYNYLRPILTKLLPKKIELKYAGRPPSASTAAGSYALHKKEQAAIMNTLFNPSKSSELDISHHFRV